MLTFVTASDFLASLHAKGWSDAAIARSISVDRSTIHRIGQGANPRPVIYEALRRLAVQESLSDEAAFNVLMRAFESKMLEVPE